jgi:RNA polymerase sigma-70 factor (ECF subfamily)
MNQASDVMDATLDLDSSDTVAADRSADRAAVARALLDPDAFSILYRKYVSDVYRYCYRRLENREAAEDVTSQVFMQAYSALSGLGDRPFRPWLFAIARNGVIDRYRRQRPPETRFDDLFDKADGAASPEELIVDRDCVDAIHQLFDQLNERDRQIVELRLAGLTGVEIAEAMHCSHAVVRTAQHRAFGKIRALLADPDMQGGPL